MGLRHAAGSLVLPVFVLVAAAVIAAGGDGLREVLRFDRPGLELNEFWRLATGHFAHLGWSHFALNATGLVLCWALVGRTFSALEWIVIMVITIAVIDAGLWLALPGLEWYVGLSGLLHGLLVAGALGSLRQRVVESSILLAVIVLKTGYEIVAGPLPGSETASGGAVVIEAHVFGAVGGLAGAVAALIGQRLRASI